MWAPLHQTLVGCYFLEVLVGQSEDFVANSELVAELWFPADWGQRGKLWSLHVGIIFTHGVSPSRTWECIISGLH